MRGCLRYDVVVFSVATAARLAVVSLGVNSGQEVLMEGCIDLLSHRLLQLRCLVASLRPAEVLRFWEAAV